MPNIQCPHKKLPGYVTARRCTAPCGGWIVLFDRRRGGPPGLEAPEGETGRYVLSHWESGNWAGVDRKARAMELLVAVAKGEDAAGILPRTVVPEGLPSPGPPPAADGGKGDSEGGDARARAGEAAGPSLPDPVAVQRALLEAFPADRIVAEYQAGLGATRGLVVRTKEGQDFSEEVVHAPDFATRIKYLDSLTKFRIGTPVPRDKPQEPKRVTFQELESIIARSPAARRALREKIEEAERQAKLPKNSPPAPGPASPGGTAS